MIQVEFPSREAALRALIIVRNHCIAQYERHGTPEARSDMLAAIEHVRSFNASWV